MNRGSEQAVKIEQQVEDATCRWEAVCKRLEHGLIGISYGMEQVGCLLLLCCSDCWLGVGGFCVWVLVCVCSLIGSLRVYFKVDCNSSLYFCVSTGYWY